MQKRTFAQRVKRVRAHERKTGRKARDSVKEVGGAGYIEFSHKIIAYIYLLVKINRKYNKKKRIGKASNQERPSPCKKQKRKG